MWLARPDGKEQPGASGFRKGYEDAEARHCRKGKSRRNFSFTRPAFLDKFTAGMRALEKESQARARIFAAWSGQRFNAIGDELGHHTLPTGAPWGRFPHHASREGQQALDAAYQDVLGGLLIILSRKSR